MSRKQRRQFDGAQKVAIVKRHLVDSIPVSEERFRLRSRLRFSLRSVLFVLLLSSVACVLVIQQQQIRTLRLRLNDLNLETPQRNAVPQLSPVTLVPDIRGSVLSVSDSGNLVLISVGQVDGVCRGMTFNVRGKQSWRGRVEVVKARDTESVARVLYRKQPMMPNDRIATRTH